MLISTNSLNITDQIKLIAFDAEEALFIVWISDLHKALRALQVKFDDWRYGDEPCPFNVKNCHFSEYKLIASKSIDGSVVNGYYFWIPYVGIPIEVPEKPEELDRPLGYHEFHSSRGNF